MYYITYLFFNTMSNPVSLLEVMDEELAQKMAREEKEFLAKEKETEYSLSECDFEEQLRLALEISAEEAKQHNEQEDEQQQQTENVDDDFLFAVQLQQQLDAEQLAHSILEQERRERDGFSKVSYTYDHGNETVYRGHHYYKPLYEDTEEREQSEDEEEEDDYDSEEEENRIIGIKPHHQVSKPGGRQIVTKHDSYISGLKNASSVEQMPHSGNLKDVVISNPVYNSLREGSKRIETHQVRVRGNKLDKSTQEQVLDKRTRVTLLELINGGVLDGLDGIISTGKESNVYFATCQENNLELAVKIFKTTLNEFKNRNDYIEGEFRFRYKKNQHNPRKFIKVWAEKELRNLKRLQAQGIPCPNPIRVRENILVMSFIGKDGQSAPRLKDAKNTESHLRSYYSQIIRIMRKMFHQCRLVHADLSEYNILVQKGQLYVIDVSQAVEYDHPRALEFLRKDCEVITNFFFRQGIQNCLSTRELFEFVSSVNIQDEDEYLENIVKQKEQNKPQSLEENMKDAIFLNKETTIPRTLHQVATPEKEIFDGKDSFHDVVTATKHSS